MPQGVVDTFVVWNLSGGWGHLGMGVPRHGVHAPTLPGGVMACANTVIALRSWLAVASRDYEAGGLRLVRLGGACVKPRTPRCGGGLSRVETTAAPARVTWPQNGVFGVCWGGTGFM